MNAQKKIGSPDYISRQQRHHPKRWAREAASPAEQMQALHGQLGRIPNEIMDAQSKELAIMKLVKRLIHRSGMNNKYHPLHGPREGGQQ